MRIHLRTRGRPRPLDYDFLNSRPANRWWDAYSDVTATERPCMLSMADDDQWRVLVSGVPSVRTDSVGTLLFYTLVLEGTHDGTTDDDRALVLALASRWLADLNGHCDEHRSLSALFDGLCPAPEVDRLLAAPLSELTADREKLTAAIHAALAGVEPVPYEPATGRGRDRWIAGRGAPGAAAAFLERLSAMLSGEEKGQAHLLNLVSEAEDVATLFPGRLAVLVEGGQVGDPAMPLEELPPLKAPPWPPVAPVPTSPPGPHPKVGWRTPMFQASLAALMLLLILAGALWIWGVPF
ncbi:hypothetical protein [Streptomyces aurantiogriseus]|uniref:Uncharacterized protein n=1 Tax=Streptomyces aurantiogriseus TaxID=66870 RepID=A0A918FIE7_9ACTN|nr:hypothetical protein [Streptomyces aurantiogriseus]GGR40012.1 hypothetical protein GCM10010251_65870 [Streptomyces aurantiogriseus]